MSTPERPALLMTKASIRAFVPQDGPVVYRIFADAECSQLVYVGASIHPRQRLYRHLLDGERIGLVVTLQVCRNTTQMAQEEARAIETEHPTINRVAGGRNGFWRAQNRSA